jgi:hypothetical protein
LEVCAQRADADPRAVRKLEVLTDATVEHQAARRIALVHQAHRVAEAIEAFVVKRCLTETASRDLSLGVLLGVSNSSRIRSATALNGL